MKIDSWFFDKKARYYNFYFCIERWVVCFAMSVAGWDLELHIGKFKSFEESYEQTRLAILETLT